MHVLTSHLLLLARFPKSCETALNWPGLSYVCLLIMPLGKWGSSLFDFYRGRQPLSPKSIQETRYWLPKIWKISITQDHKNCKTWKHISKLIKVDSAAYVHIIIYIASLFFDRWSDHALYLYYFIYCFLKLPSNIRMHNFFFLAIFPSDCFMEKTIFE